MKIKKVFDFVKNKTYKTIANIFTKAANISGYYSGNGYSDYGSGSKYPLGLSYGSTTPVVLHNHLAIRQNVREKMHDSVDCRALVKSIVDTVVDTGRKLKPTPNPDILGITPEAAEEWSEKVAEGFHLWAKSKKSHRSRINNFYQNQRLYQLFQQRDNDIFTRFYYGRDKDLINPLQIDFLDPNQIRGVGFTSTYSQYGFDDGIIRDASNREIGYRIWYYDAQTGKYEETKIPAVGEKSKRIFMTHGYNPEYAGQGRGYSQLAHLIQELASLTDFKLSVIQKAINQASFIGAVENEMQDASQPLAGRVAGPIAEYGSYGEDNSESNIAESTEPIINWQAMPEATIHQPGSVLMGNLRRGDKIKYLQDTSPGQMYESFENAFFSSIASSMGWSAEVVKKKFSNNYSASRATLILVWRTAQIEGAEMDSDFNDPVYEMWLSEEIAKGRISAPGWSDPKLKDAWLCCEWTGLPMPNIDPLKTAEADKEYAAMSAQTLDDIARNYNGSSGKANRAKNARQFQELPTPPWPRAPIQQDPYEEEE